MDKNLVTVLTNLLMVLGALLMDLVVLAKVGKNLVAVLTNLLMVLAVLLQDLVALVKEEKNLIMVFLNYKQEPENYQTV